MNSIQLPRPIQSGEDLEKAVYCAECKVFEQDLIGCKVGTCLGHSISDSNTPMVCSYFKNDTRIISVLVFLPNGISIYHKAIVKDLAKDIDPNLLTSFLQAISSFGQELASEQISQIQFQKMNIVFCRGKYCNGALIVRGKLDEHSKDMFSHFINKLENAYPDYFEGEFRGLLLPETEIDKIATESMKEYAKENLYPIPRDLIETRFELKYGGDIPSTF